MWQDWIESTYPGEVDIYVSSFIHHEMNEAAKAVDGKSLRTCLLEAKMIKTNKRRDSWIVANCL